MHQNDLRKQWVGYLLMGLILALIFPLAVHASPITEIKQLDWSAESSQVYINRQAGIWADGKTATVIDIQTGSTFSAVRYRGTNHADFEPAAQTDTDIIKEIYGGWSWDRRPVLVIIDGAAFAASMNGMPHGTESIEDNCYPGHSCIHFFNSKTHCSCKVDEAHQAAVMIAYNTDLLALNKRIHDG